MWGLHRSAKAFDTVDYHILLHKLSHYGIRGVINKWFCSYFNGRTQTTQCANKLFLNIKKTNFVIFHPYQKRLDYKV